MRVSRNTHAPLSLPGTLSTAGHWDQSRVAMFRPPFLLTFYHGLMPGSRVERPRANFARLDGRGRPSLHERDIATVNPHSATPNGKGRIAAALRVTDTGYELPSSASATAAGAAGDATPPPPPRRGDAPPARLRPAPPPPLPTPPLHLRG